MKGFWAVTPAGRTVHIRGNPNMDEESRRLLLSIADKAHDQVERNHLRQLYAAPNLADVDTAGADFDLFVLWLLAAIVEEQLLTTDDLVQAAARSLHYLPPGHDGLAASLGRFLQLALDQEEEAAYVRVRTEEVMG